MQLASTTYPDALPQGWAAGRRSPKGVVRWYAVRVPEGREATTAAKLRALIPADLMSDAFQITKERWFKRAGSWSLQAKPLFPGWVIVATDDARALDQALRGLTLNVRLASGDGRTFIPMDKSAQAFYEGAMDAGHCLRNSVGLLGANGLRVVEGPLTGREADVSRFDRHRRFCLVNGGGGPEPFCESMPLDIPEAI